MEKLDLIYDLIKQIREKQDEDHDVLMEHQRRSLANEARLELLEKHALKINWKTIWLLVGIVAASTTAAINIIKLLGM